MRLWNDGHHCLAVNPTESFEVIFLSQPKRGPCPHSASLVPQYSVPIPCIVLSIPKTIIRRQAHTDYGREWSQINVAIYTYMAWNVKKEQLTSAWMVHTGNGLWHRSLNIGCLLLGLLFRNGLLGWRRLSVLACLCSLGTKLFVLRLTCSSLSNHTL